LDLVPLSLVLLAALLHAAWNFLVKGSEDPLTALWAALCAALVFYFPLFLLRLPGAQFEPGGWIFVLATGVLHTVYFFTLGLAYRAGDLSAVYPLARGSAPLMVVVLAAFFLKERISLAGGAAILLVVAGIYVIHLKGFRAGDWLSPIRRGRETAVRWALATGLTTAAYSVVDKAGVARVSPEIYIYLMFLLSILFMAPYTLTGARAVRVRELLRDRAALLRTAAGGICTMAGYMLVLFAMRMSKVSYVVAAREVSVVIGAALGVFVLKEGGARQKLLGSALIAGGLTLLALAR